jgi:hypothetical protein
LNPFVLKEAPLLSYGKRNPGRAEVWKSDPDLIRRMNREKEKKNGGKSRKDLIHRNPPTVWLCFAAVKAKNLAGKSSPGFVKQIEGVTGSEDPADTIFA